jgi:hypothetical protein
MSKVRVPTIRKMTKKKHDPLQRHRTDPEKEKREWFRLLMAERRHISYVPQRVPTGKMLVHTRDYREGDRHGAWLSPLGTKGYVVCHCPWAPKAGRHYRERHPPNWRDDLRRLRRMQRDA